MTHLHTVLCDLIFLCHMGRGGGGGGGGDVTTHVRGKHHKDMAKASSTSSILPVQTFFVTISIIFITL